MNCWPDEFRREHERWISVYPPAVQAELRESREKWLRSERLECCKRGPLGIES